MFFSKNTSAIYIEPIKKEIQNMIYNYSVYSLVHLSYKVDLKINRP